MVRGWARRCFGYETAPRGGRPTGQFPKKCGRDLWSFQANFGGKGGGRRAEGGRKKERRLPPTAAGFIPRIGLAHLPPPAAPELPKPAGKAIMGAMGIRFYCPNGHKLNVKEFQAGRKGICPFCGAKIQIPTESARPSSRTERGAGRPAGCRLGGRHAGGRDGRGGFVVGPAIHAASPTPPGDEGAAAAAAGPTPIVSAPAGPSPTATGPARRRRPRSIRWSRPATWCGMSVPRRAANSVPLAATSCGPGWPKAASRHSLVWRGWRDWREEAGGGVPRNSARKIRSPPPVEPRRTHRGGVGPPRPHAPKLRPVRT